MKKILLSVFLSMGFLLAQNGQKMKIGILNPTDDAPRLSVKLSLKTETRDGLHIQFPAGLKAVLESATINGTPVWLKQAAGPVQHKNRLNWLWSGNGIDIQYFGARVGDVLSVVVRPDSRHLKRFRKLNLSAYPIGANKEMLKNRDSVQLPLNYIKANK